MSTISATKLLLAEYVPVRQKLKLCLQNARFYNPHANTKLHNYAGLGLGGILLQYQQDESLHHVAYFSRLTTKEKPCYHSCEFDT